MLRVAGRDIQSICMSPRGCRNPIFQQPPKQEGDGALSVLELDCSHESHNFECGTARQPPRPIPVCSIRLSTVPESLVGLKRMSLPSTTHDCSSHRALILDPRTPANDHTAGHNATLRTQGIMLPRYMGLGIQDSGVPIRGRSTIALKDREVYEKLCRESESVNAQLKLQKKQGKKVAVLTERDTNSTADKDNTSHESTVRGFGKPGDCCKPVLSHSRGVSFTPSERSTFRYTPTYFRPDVLTRYKFDADLATALAQTARKRSPTGLRNARCTITQK